MKRLNPIPEAQKQILIFWINNQTETENLPVLLNIERLPLFQVTPEVFVYVGCRRRHSRRFKRRNLRRQEVGQGP